MNLEEYKKFFKEELEKNSLCVEENEIPLFFEYMKQIIEWNEKINVTAITDEKEFVIKHFIDSLTIADYIEKNDRVIDIGTGAGFPGIPIKIVKPNANVTLIDSVNKKLNVIRDVSENIKLTNLEIIHTRAEDLANNPKYRESFDIATTRAVSNFATIVEYMLPFIKVGGKAICMKGPNFNEELEKSQKAIELLGGRVKNVQTCVISSDLERNIIIVEKIKNTPKNYPRGKGKPLKEPLY